MSWRSETPEAATPPDEALPPRSRPVRDWLSRNRTVLLALVTWVVFAAVAYTTYRITGDIRYEDILHALEATTWTDILIAGFFTVVSFVLLAGYDVNALRHLGKQANLVQVGMIAFSAYAIGNTVGFGPLSAGAVRYRGYSRLGLSGEQIAGVIAFVTLSFGLGLTVTTALAALVAADQVAGFAGLTPQMLRLLSAGLLVALTVAAAILWRSDGWLRPHMPRPGIAIGQLAITAADLMVCATVLWVLLPQDLQVSWISFVIIYAIAIGLGVLSHVPAGLGVLEAVILTTLGGATGTDALLGSLVLYRVIYHVVPLLIAVVVVAWTEALEALHSPRLEWAQRMGTLLAPSLLGSLAVICGVMLIFSSVIPAREANLVWLAGYVPALLIEGAHFLSSLIGLVLFVAARGLTQRLDGAYWLTLGAASAAFFFTFVKALAPYEAVMLAALIGFLLLSRPLFDRPASLFAQTLTPPWIAGIATVAISAITILLFVQKDVAYSHELWWQFEISAEAPRGLRALLGVVVLSALIAIRSLMQPTRPEPGMPDEAELKKALAIVERQDMGEANLVRMRDKSLIFSDAGDAFLMYAVQGQSWISLFGPIGAPRAQAELIWRFIETARAKGGRPVFYQVPPSLLPLCADAGLRGLKLGERAVVDLEAMDLHSSQWAEQRQALRKGERMGLAFELLEPATLGPILDELQQVSDAWLAHHDTREKGFALGRFERDYVAEQPVAVLRAEGRIVAFATVMQTGTKAEATLDLMRFARSAPPGSMDVLLCNLLVEMKRQGFRSFNLGMAPLSGITAHQAAPFWNHLGQSVFEHGERFYNFRGLRSFKAKYRPEWQSRYLVTPGGVSPLAALVDVTLLIGGGLRGVMRK
ncbi:bifunctional lysylphosphatidylglycerol flippase/synthetase MprF [Cereibacter johrii]|uniref:bifunctional lysylphosphatidylglycerol flippase/synthetase MprF n=1 Tax=Cereibacter johrii TaxID=445629 RepID=UPI000DCF102B|nr:bifunctional lysylphosphatidylglycerol flippase/synthetase MprF [Cereibacter johrii]RAZ85129.1 bifunctional lysylphosphatidylglycerol flippase/synthetase MprF [Cereibacter johrii]